MMQLLYRLHIITNRHGLKDIDKINIAFIPLRSINNNQLTYITIRIIV